MSGSPGCRTSGWTGWPRSTTRASWCTPRWSTWTWPPCPPTPARRKLKAGAGLSDTIAANIRQVDAIAHVVRAFEDAAIPHVGEINPLRDIQNMDFDLIVSDLGQVEKRLERLQKT